ncbi:MAG: hypothetical protein V7707_19985 [Motiliproteus sp.]
MIIDSSRVGLSAEHQKLEISEKQKSHSLFIQQLQMVAMQGQSSNQLGYSGGSAERPEWVGPVGGAEGSSTPTVNPTTGKDTDNSVATFFPQWRGVGANNRPAFLLSPFGMGQQQGFGGQLGLGGQGFGEFQGVGGMSGLGGLTRTDGMDSSFNSTMRLFQALFNSLAGRSHPVNEPAANPDANDDGTAPPTGNTGAGVQGPGPGSRLGFGSQMLEVNVHVSEYYKEMECSSFSACGTVQTRDGKSIDFNLNLEMSRSYEVTREYQATEMVEFTDPLVVNFDGNAAELSEEKYEFDLDADGNNEWISFVGANSGLLALDRNKDGAINDGTELFGALSGDGFADLAKYDDDGNGFIDEADAIFGDLRIWSKTSTEDRLETLQQRDIGAIYLGASETPFDLKDEQNDQHGRVRQTGIYLQEDGGVGTVQQIDMVV